MEAAYSVMKSAFILLGIITLLLGRYLSDKIIMPRRIRYKVISEKGYIKASRMIFYSLGLYYIAFGIILLLITGWPWIITFFSTIIPSLIVVVLSQNCRKYIQSSIEGR